MKVKKFSKEWFENKLKQYKNMPHSYGNKLTPTKGWRTDLRSQNKKYQRIESLYKLAKEKKIKISD